MPIDLDELERLAAQVSPGPWTVDKDLPYCFIDTDSRFLGFAATRNPYAYDNAAYIAAACNAAPELIARVRELERMVDIMAEDMGDSSHAGGYYRVCRGCKDADDFGIGGCGKDCLKKLYEQAAKEVGE